MMQLLGLLTILSGLAGQVQASIEIDSNGEVEPTCGVGIPREDLADWERDVTNLLQADLATSTYSADRASGSTRVKLVQLLSGSRKDAQAPGAPKAAGESGGVAAANAAAANAATPISQAYWNNADKVLNSAALSTPLPSAASINAPPPAPKDTPWEDVMHQSKQPLDTKLGSAIMDRMSGGVTQTPPPAQATIDQQFVAQCPMVLFRYNLSIRGPSKCDNTRGQWIATDPSNVRPIMRWETLGNGKLSFGVDSAISGPGTALFADITQDFTLNSYKFKVRNCLGVDRWHVEEMVYKVNSMGHVDSTLELHDTTRNGVAYFYRYVITKPDGKLFSQSSLYRKSATKVFFNHYVNGLDTGVVLATATKQGTWMGEGWRECMSPTSPRGWSIHFTPDSTGNISSHATMATVQDIRVAIAGAITLMAHRDESRGSDGINAEGGQTQMLMLAGGVALVIVVLILVVNCCMVFRASGLRDKLKRALFESEGAFLPKSPHQNRTPAFHATY